MLTDAQKETVREWVRAGASLSNIQNRLRDELGTPMTYMDVRMLVLDLGVAVKDKEKPVEKKPQPAPPPAAANGEEGLDEFADEDVQTTPIPEPGLGGGSVAVEVDRLMRPGYLVSGTVVFSDGTKAKWGLDQMGRLALDAGKPGYSPSREDIQAFQQALHQELRKRGF